MHKIGQYLKELKVPFFVENGADLTINTEFLDASWRIGSKTLSYEASILFDENKKTVFMYEKTAEKGQGVSLGASGESSFQSGATLFRKVKSILHGPDGKVYEYTFDLGAIPKAVKDTAKEYDWKFKTVLSRKKASYSAGYVKQQEAYPVNGQQQASDSVTVQPTQQYSNVSQPKAPEHNHKKNGLFIAGSILLCLTMLFLYAVSGASMIGWSIAVIILGITLILMRKCSSKGCFSGIIIFVISLILLFFVLVFTLPE